jgi:HD-GYP domain-containing protein (c-di-GMP phosphodiesterase class II)
MQFDECLAGIPRRLIEISLAGRFMSQNSIEANSCTSVSSLSGNQSHHHFRRFPVVLESALVVKAVVVDLVDVADGSELASGIRDARGRLLLASGMVLTSNYRQKLLARGIRRVLLSEPDAVRVKGRASFRAPGPKDPALDESGELNRSGMLSTHQAGPPLLARVVDHGVAPYRPNAVNDILGAHATGVIKLQSIVKSIDRGASPAFDRIVPTVDELIQSMLWDIDGSLSALPVLNRDASLVTHAMNCALLGMAMGIDLGFDALSVQTIGISGMVMDLGMSHVSDEIRDAPRRLSAVEATDIQKHPKETDRILELAEGIPPLVRVIAYQVHERPDGSGYPHGRARTNIHPFARILHVADAYLAMTARRPFRPPLMPYAALECLLYQAELNQVDREVVRSLLRVLSLFPIGSHVKLNDSSLAQVVRANPRDFTRPIVSRVPDDERDRPLKLDAVPFDLSQSVWKVARAVPAPGSDEIPLSADVANWSVRAASFINEQELLAVS